MKSIDREMRQLVGRLLVERQFTEDLPHHRSKFKSVAWNKIKTKWCLSRQKELLMLQCLPVPHPGGTLLIQEHEKYCVLCLDSRKDVRISTRESCSNHNVLPVRVLVQDKILVWGHLQKSLFSFKVYITAKTREQPGEKVDVGLYSSSGFAARNSGAVWCTF